MTTLNIIDRSNRVEEQIAEIEKDVEIKVNLITSKFDMIDAQFEAIFGRTWRRTLGLAKANRIDKESEEVLKAIAINEKIGEKISMIKEEARKKIKMIKEEEKQNKLADLDQLVNEIIK